MREQPTHDPLQRGPEAPEPSRKLRRLEEGDFVLCEVVGDGSLRVLYPRYEELEPALLGLSGRAA